MIVTKKPQLVDAKNGIEEIVYIRVANALIVGEEIHFPIELFTLTYKESTRDKAVLNEEGQMTFGENGMPITEKESILVPNLNKFLTETAIFKAETYKSKIGVYDASEFDKAFIDQMEFVNSFDWSKTDKKKVRYWNLKAKDVEIISDAEFAQLVKTKISKK